MTESHHTLVVTGKSIGMSKVQSEINTLYSSSGRDVSRLGSQVQRFGHHSFAALAIFKGLAIYRGFGMITQQLSEGVQQAIEFEKSMANVNSLLLVGETELRSYANFAAQMGQALPLTMNMIAEGMYDIVSAGILVRKEIEAVAMLAGTAAVAGVSDLRTAVQAGIGSMNAFGKSVDNLEHIYNVHFMTVKMGILTYEQLAQVMGRVSASAALAGQQLETANAALVAISRGGFGGVAFAEGSTRVVRFFQELSDPSTHKRLRELGISVFDSFGKMRNAIDIVVDLQGKLATMTVEAQNETVNQIFTNIRSAQGFQVLSQQIDIWSEAQMRAIFSAGAMADAFEKQKDTVDAALTTLQNKFTDAMRSVVTAVAPAIDRISHVFDTLGKNLWPLIMMIGILSAKYITGAVAAKMHASAILMNTEQTRLSSLQTQQHDLILRQDNITKHLDMQITLAQAGAKKQSLLATWKETAAIRGKIVATDAAIVSTQTNIHMLKMQRFQTITMTSAIIGMTAGFYFMSKGQTELGAIIMGATTALHTMAILLPVMTTLTQGLTFSTEMLHLAYWKTAIAQAAASAGLTALAAAAGIAIVVGALTASMLSISGATDEATESVVGYTDVIGQMEEEQEGLASSVKNLVDQLIEEGRALGFITDQVKLLVETSSGLGGAGPAMVAGLATQHFAMVEGQGIVAPQIAEGEVAQRSLASLGITGEGADAFLQIQTILREMVTSTDEWDQQLGAIYATNIFGTDFGQSLISIWQDYGKELTLVDEEHKELFKGARKYVDDYLADIVGSYERTAAAMDIEEVYKTVKAEKKWGPWMAAEDMRAAWVEIQIGADETYRQAQTLIGEWFAIGDIVSQGAEEMAMSAQEAFEAIQKSVGAWADSLSDVMKVDNMVETMIGAGEQLDAAGYYFGGVAGNWDALGDQWAKIQKMWMGLQMIQTIMGVADSLANLPAEIATEQQAVYGAVPTETALRAQEIQSGSTYQQLMGVLANASSMPTGARTAMQHWIDTIDMLAAQTEQAVVGYDVVTSQTGLEFEGLRTDIYNALLPIFSTLGPGLADNIGDILGALLGNFGDPGFWDTLFDPMEEEIILTIEEMASTFIDTITGAGGFGGAIESFVEHSKILEDAGYYFKDVAGGWQMLGEEWARIQSYFKISEMINSFIQSANAMKEYGVALPEEFTNNMYSLMQVMATQVLPDFQNVIDELIGNVGSADFWDALASGMSEAQITQSNSITLAPYIVISERADAEDIIQVVHDALVEEAKRAGFTWAGG